MYLKALLSVHDTVAQKNFDPVLPPLPDDFDEELEEESVKIVRLVKNKEPLVRRRNRRDEKERTRILRLLILYCTEMIKSAKFIYFKCVSILKVLL